MSTRTLLAVSEAGAPQFRSGLWYTSPGAGGGAGVLAQSELRVFPFPVPQAVTLDRMAVDVTVGAASSTVRLGIYADDTTGGYPGALLLDAGTIDASTTGVKELTISQSLTPGLWWLGAASQGGTPTVRLGQDGHPGVGAESAANLSVNIPNGYSQTGVTGALPSPFTTSPALTSNVHKVMVRVV